MNTEVTVIFNLNGVEIKTSAIAPAIDNAVSKRVMTINNALAVVKRELGIDLRDNNENIYDFATVID